VARHQIVNRRVRWTALAIVGTLLCAPSAAGAEPTPPRPLASAIAALAASQSPPRPSRSRDSLKNGAIIGAVAGAAALGGFGLFLCHALDDSDGNLDCIPGALVIAAVGAGIGAGAGVGIDALLVRRAGPAVRIHVRF
jgi:hypothetical protein